LRRHRFPPSDSLGAGTGLCIVGDLGKSAAQFDRSRQLALLIEDSADRGGIRLGDDEHA
jgi:hypothetical protein